MRFFQFLLINFLLILVLIGNLFSKLKKNIFELFLSQEV